MLLSPCGLEPLNMYHLEILQRLELLLHRHLEIILLKHFLITTLVDELGLYIDHVDIPWQR